MSAPPRENRPGEDDLIARYFAPLAGPAGLGLLDDAALLRPEPGQDLVLSTDALVAGVHFFADDLPGSIARKALRVNVSDLAAKGARPVGYLLALALPPDWTAAWLAAFAAGLEADGAAYGIALLGGDTVATPGPLTLSITAVGSVPAGTMVPRTGARVGDFLYVSGTIGDAALGLRLRLAAPADRVWIDRLDDPARKHLADRYLHPQPRLDLASALRARAHGAMDVSDGLVGDAAKLLRASGVGGLIELARVPLSEAATSAPEAFATAVTGGDDYEILCALPPGATGAFEAEAQRAGVAVTRIGRVTAGAVRIIGRDGQAFSAGRASFSHF